MGLFDPKPHFYYDERRLCELVFKYLPKGRASSAEDPLVAHHVKSFVDLVEGHLITEMGHEAYLNDFAFRAMAGGDMDCKTLDAALHGRTDGVSTVNHPQRWKIVSLVLYGHYENIGPTDKVLRKIWSSFLPMLKG
jgi:hypothetical protein